MKKFYKQIFCLFGIFIFLSGCQSLKDGLEGKKKSNNAQEFLIEKKNPLVLPPDYEKLPVPKSASKESNSSNQFDLEKILNDNSKKDTSSELENNSSVEKSLLEKIKSN